jgi:two-component system, OmpR family, sensor histidine kinase KdpD
LGFFPNRKYKIQLQIVWSLSLVLCISLICFLSKEVIGYRIVAMILLVVVSVLAMLFDIIPVLLAAILSAIIWNFFFIPPLFTFHIGSTEDLLMFFLYFIIALINAVLTNQIRKEEQKSRDKEEKEKTLKLYDTLLNSLSHELRTPVATILSSVDILKENEQISPKNREEILNEIDVASVRLNGQIENLLNMSRLESGMLKLGYDWEDISDLIYAIIHKIQVGNKNTPIVFQAESKLPLCKVDAGILEQILFNLLQNARQYSPINTKIYIRSWISSETLHISIQDEGPGVPEELIGHIFDKFYRVSNTKSGGIGLGLAIVKGFVEAHNGNITVENTSPSGLKFLITIPVEVSYINNLKNE